MDNEELADSGRVLARRIRTNFVLVGAFFAATALIRGSVESFGFQVLGIAVLITVVLVLWRFFGAWPPTSRGRSGPPDRTNPRERSAVVVFYVAVFGSLLLSSVLGPLGREHRGELGYWIPALLATALPTIVGGWWLARQVQAGPSA